MTIAVTEWLQVIQQTMKNLAGLLYTGRNPKVWLNQS